jgi:hypothetical protein
VSLRCKAATTSGRRRNIAERTVPGAATDTSHHAAVRSLRILERSLLVIILIVPVPDPFACISGHVFDPIRRRAFRQRADRRPCLVAVPLAIEFGACRSWIAMPPKEAGGRQYQGRPSPLRFSRETLLCPGAIGRRVLPCDFSARGYRVSYLGPNVLVAELAAFCELIEPKLIFLSLTTVPTSDEAAVVIVGGAAA